MEIKGTAVKTAIEYVKEKHSDKFKEWIEQLPPASKKIMLEPIYATSWYSLEDAIIQPTIVAGNMLFGGNHEKASWSLGEYSSEMALKGIYKIFIRVSSPNFVMSRAANVFATYYHPAEIKVLPSGGDKKALLQFSQFHKGDELIIPRIAGWIKKTIEITQRGNIVVKTDKNYTGEMLTFTISAEWQ